MSSVYYIVLAILGLWYGSAFCKPAKKIDPMRDLIILLDDREEVNAGKAGFAITHLCHALMSEAAPLLVSAPLWHTFINLRQEWLLLSQVPDTREHTSAQFFDDINASINHWYSVLHGTCDDVHMRAIIADKINEQFFTPKQLDQFSKTDSSFKETMHATLRARFAAKQHFDAWYWFYLDTGHYLIIPKKYATRFTNSSKCPALLTALGFSPDIASCVVDPLTIDPVSIMQLKPTDTTIMPALKKLFSLKKEHIWTIFIAGHGWSSNTLFGVHKQIVGITLETFKEICAFFNTALTLNLLWAVSCFAGGVHRLDLTDAQYQYAIVLESLSDTPSYTSFNTPQISNESSFHCRRDYIRPTADNRWELWYEQPRQFADFFEKIHEMHRHATSNQSAEPKATQDLIYEAFVQLLPQDYIENWPHMLPPHSTQWLLCYPLYASYLNIHAALLAELCNTPHLLHKHTILIDAPVLKAGFNLENNRIQFIAFITPGPSTHYIGPVNTPHMDIKKFASVIWPSFKPNVDRQVLFESITCQCDPKDSLTQMLGVTESSITLRDVLMHIVKHEQVEFIFTAPNGDIFYATVRLVDNKPMFRNLQKLSEPAAASYRSHYDTTKANIIAIADEAYASLRNHYMKAMNLNQETVVS